MRDAFIKALCDIAAVDKRIFLITGDLGFGVLDHYRKNFPDQFLNVGVAEQNMTGVATGLALEGRIVFTYSIANFCTLRCLEQIRNDACYHNANVKVVSVGAGFSYGSLGASHHATEDISIMRSLPDITIFSPGDDAEAVECTKALVATPGTGYLRLDRMGAAQSSAVQPEFKVGVPRVVRQGDDVALVTTGGVLTHVLKAADDLQREGISCRVISLHTLKPIQQEILLESLAGVKAVYSIEEHSIEGGLGGLLAENILEGSLNLKVFRRIGLRVGFSSVVGDQEYLRTKYGIDAPAIYQCVKESYFR